MKKVIKKQNYIVMAGQAKSIYHKTTILAAGLNYSQMSGQAKSVYCARVRSVA